MPEACPATCGSDCAAGHGPKLVPSAPYEPPHQAPTGACAKAGTANATTANSATTPVHFICPLRSLRFTAPTSAHPNIRNTWPASVQRMCQGLLPGAECRCDVDLALE